MNDTNSRPGAFMNGWRIAGWGSLAALLLLPALAMRLTDQVDWSAGDFVFAGALLLFLGLAVEGAVRFARSAAARTGYLIAGGTAFFTMWANAAVGIIGDDFAINKWFFAMVLAGAIAGAVARFRPAAMRWIAGAIGVGQYAVGLAALAMMPGHRVEWEILALLALAWFAAAWCFHRALRV